MRPVLLGEKSRSRDQRLVVLLVLLAVSLILLETRHQGIIASIFSWIGAVAMAIWDYFRAAADAIMEIIRSITRSVSG